MVATAAIIGTTVAEKGSSSGSRELFTSTKPQVSANKVSMLTAAAATTTTTGVTTSISQIGDGLWKGGAVGGVDVVLMAV